MSNALKTFLVISLHVFVFSLLALHGDPKEHQGGDTFIFLKTIFGKIIYLWLSAAAADAIVVDAIPNRMAAGLEVSGENQTDRTTDWYLPSPFLSPTHVAASFPFP